VAYFNVLPRNLHGGTEKNKISLVGFVVLTGVAMKRSIFCRAVKVNRCFGGKYLPHLKGEIVSQARNQHEVDRVLYSPETSINFHLATRRYVPEDRTQT
jgi:hypothetical protein